MIKTNRISQPSQLLPHLPYRRRQRWCVSVFTDRTNATVYASNGNTYTTGTNNELTSDGDYTYTYDAEGNRISKSNSTDRELYEWDYRNRLTKVTQQTFNAESQTWETVQIVEYAYDYNNIWIRKTLDPNGDGTADSKTIFIPESYQTTVQLDDANLSDATGPTSTHHYLWTPNTQDKLLADTTPTEVLWSLTDHLGTIRDVLGTTSTHLIYDAFGNLISGTNPLLFGYTGKAFDTDTDLQNNINRWCDATVGRWLSTDPIGFEGNDTNLYRYVGNKGHFLDPKGTISPSIIKNLLAPYQKNVKSLANGFLRLGEFGVASTLRVEISLRMKNKNHISFEVTDPQTQAGAFGWDKPNWHGKRPSDKLEEYVKSLTEEADKKCITVRHRLFATVDAVKCKVWKTSNMYFWGISYTFRLYSELTLINRMDRNDTVTITEILFAIGETYVTESG